MRAERIYTDLIQFLTITECEIDKSVNQHGRAVIKGVLQAGENAIDKITDITKIAVYIEDEKKKKIFFSGIVENMAVQTVNGSVECQVSIVGATRLMDVEKKTRTFQNADMTYEEVIDTVDNEYSAIFQSGDQVKNAISDFIVQYKETDWEFILRMASNVNACVIPDFTTSQICYYVGLPQKTGNFTCDSVEYSRKKEINCLRNYGGRMVRNSEVDDVVTFVHREALDLGTLVTVEGAIYYVYRVKSFLRKEELVHEYELRKKVDFEVKKLYNFMLVGASLDAQIIDVKAAKVKVKVDVDAVQNKETAKWFPYSSVFSSPDGTGWYCMPEIGDKVRMYFPSEKESDAYVISAVHVEGGGESRSNPDNKSIMNKFNKQVELTPTTITLTNGKGMSFEIDDSNGITIISDKNITFIAEKDVQMTSLNESVELDATEKVELSQNGKGIVIDGDITFTTGSVHIQK